MEVFGKVAAMALAGVSPQLFLSVQGVALLLPVAQSLVTKLQMARRAAAP